MIKDFTNSFDIRSDSTHNLFCPEEKVSDRETYSLPLQIILCLIHTMFYHHRDDVNEL